MKKNKVYRVLCFFDYMAATGFGTVSANIMPRLEKEFDGRVIWDIVAINYFGAPYKTKSKTVVGQSADKEDRYIRREFLNMLDKIDYDVVFMINDPGVVCPMVPVMKKIKEDRRKSNRKQFKTIFYFPIDAVSMSTLLEGIEFFDVLVPYTEFARVEVLKYNTKLRSKMQVILHGVNSSDFMQISESERHEFREAYFGKENMNRKIIGNVNRNQPRKDIPATLFSFVRYRREYDDTALLYLHMNPKDEMGHDLRFICQQLGLVENKDVMFPPQELIDKQPEPKYLCMIYNALDVFVTTTTGEGFGLTVLEAMKCGVPVIAPLHTSLRELAGTETNQNFYPIIPFGNMATHMDSIVREHVSAGDVSEAIYRVFEYPEETEFRVDNALEFAASLDWNIVIKKWIDLFNETL
jgi:D-inositol-3-phosphate glycosyltransferase